MDSGNNLKEMSFWDHLDALRSVLIKIAVLLVVLMVGLFIAMPSIFDSVILAPCDGNFILYRVLDQISTYIPGCPPPSTEGYKVELINIELSSQFFVHMSTSFWLALVFGFPVVIYLLWTFVEPALYPNEKRGASKVFVFGNLMFFIGIAVGYFVLFPVTLRFFADYHVSEKVPNQISLDSYMDNFMMMVFMMGVIFEFPLLAWMLGRMGIIHRNFFSKFRRHAVVALLVFSAVITPADPFSMIVVFIPMYALYELSAFLVKPAPRDINTDENA